MGKKKKKHHPHQPEFLAEIDKSLDKKYVDLINEIQFMQADLKRETKKAKKKQKKKLKKGGGFYSTIEYEKMVRRNMINEMEGTNFFERASNILMELQPICATIAKLVMTLIIGVLSIDSIKYTIKPETLRKVSSLYELARSVSSTTR